ncbi:flp pilus assembly protein RcpC/CpaB [alpha proteobacterium U9-1i]|nr:flp pilus assembly protein RcpC/CpaB [alpha proteobacterium U9-1i]
MSARQIIVLVVAAVAAIGALLLIRGMGAREAEPTAAAPVVGEEVLVAARDLPQGAALQPSDFRVVAFPNEAVSAGMLRAAAQSELVGAVTRRSFVQGEPLTTVAVMQPNGRGFMAAVLEPGLRAISIPVDTETAAGGFIQPNDRVDVIVTYEVEAQGEASAMTMSEILLEDVRILALDDKVDTQTSGGAPERLQPAVAVLELNPDDARVLANAEQRGDISLALRGVETETVALRGSSRRAGTLGGGASTEVRVHAYGNVRSGGSR